MDNYERALHSKGDPLKEIRGRFDNPPDVVAHPRTEQELEAVLEWCSDCGHAAIPYGGGSSSANGVTRPDGWDGIVTSTWTSSTASLAWGPSRSWCSACSRSSPRHRPDNACVKLSCSSREMRRRSSSYARATCSAQDVSASRRSRCSS